MRIAIHENVEHELQATKQQTALAGQNEQKMRSLAKELEVMVDNVVGKMVEKITEAHDVSYDMTEAANLSAGLSADVEDKAKALKICISVQAFE